MTTDPPPRDARPPRRPLASVGIPLLREERSAVRNRRLARVAIAGAVLAMAGGGLALWLRQGKPEARPREPAPAVAGSSMGDVAPEPTGNELPAPAIIDPLPQVVPQPAALAAV